MRDIMNKNNIFTENIFIRSCSMNKRFSVVFIFMALILSCGYVISNSAKTEAFAENIGELNEVLCVQSKAAYTIDADSGTVIFSQNENERLPIASMCKIMTLLVIMENIDNGVLSVEADIPVSKNASGMGGSQVFLESGTTYKAGELIKGIVVASANDACVAMAEFISGSEVDFVRAMNEKVKDLSMENTVFVNCTGLPAVGQFSCAKDVVKMFAELIKHDLYFEYSNIWLDKISHPNDRITEISNTNKLIRFYQGCDCGKTGYTSEAGHCLCASAKRNGMRIITAVISAPDSKTRFNDVSSTFNYSFSNYQNKLVVDNDKLLDLPVLVGNGKKDTVSVAAEKPVYYFAQKKEKIAVEISFCPKEHVVAPILCGDVLGELKIYNNGVLYKTVNVVAKESIEKATYFDYLQKVIDKWSICG